MTRGFRYTLEPEKLRDYMRLSVEQKLAWLEEIRLFSQEARTPQAQKIAEFFRRGE